MILELFRKKRFDVLVLMIAAFFPIYRYSISGVILPTFSVIAICLYFSTNQNVDKSLLARKLQYFFVSSGFYLLMVFSLVYTSNLKAGLSILVHGIYLILYPLIIIFFVGEISKKILNQIITCFMTACGVYMIYVHICFYNAGLYSNFKPAEFNELPFRDVLMGLPFGSIHPTYLSMWFLFSALFLIHFLFEYKARLVKLLVIGFCIAVLVGSSVLLSVKITMIAFFLSLLVLVYLMLKNKWLAILSFAFIAAIFFLSVYNISFLRARFIDEFRATELKTPIGLNTNSLNIRVGIYKCTFETFKNNWLIGTGVGDSQDELNKCYESFDTNVYRESVYDTHNNYMDIAVSTGIVGLLAFIYMLFFHLRESIRQKNTLFIVFLVFIMICMLPENILSRNHGVVFYTLFSSLLMKLNLKEGPKV